ESPSTAKAPRSIDGVDADGWRERLIQTAGAKLYNQGADALLALAQLDAERLREPRTRAAAVAVIVGIAFERNERADAVFDALTGGLGGQGLGLPSAIVRSRGGTEAYRRATSLLDASKVLDRASPA